MIPTPHEEDELKKHVRRINFLLVREPVQKELIIAFTENDGGIPSESLRIALVEFYTQNGWGAETGQGETSNQYQIRLSRP